MPNEIGYRPQGYTFFYYPTSFKNYFFLGGGLKIYNPDKKVIINDYSPDPLVLKGVEVGVGNTGAPLPAATY